MATIGEAVLERLTNLEQRLADPDSAKSPEGLRREVTALKDQIGRLTPVDGRGGSQRSIYNSKEFLPAMLGNDCKQVWRT